MALAGDTWRSRARSPSPGGRESAPCNRPNTPKTVQEPSKKRQDDSFRPPFVHKDLDTDVHHDWVMTTISKCEANSDDSDSDKESVSESEGGERVMVCMARCRATSRYVALGPPVILDS